jgi:hypothetical protein
MASMRDKSLAVMWCRLLVTLFVLALATPVRAQTPAPAAETPTPTPTEPAAEPTPTITFPRVDSPGVLFPPFLGLDILAAPAAQGPLILTPSLTISEEWNDNIFQNNDNKQSDFITQFTPALRLDVRERGFNVGVGYSLTAEVYADHTELSDAANRQTLIGNLFYEATPRLTLTLTETFRYDKASNAASVEGISSGRRDSWSNVFAPALRYQLTQRLGLRAYGAWQMQRYGSGEDADGGDGGQDSDTYRAGTGLDYALTPRLGVSGGYDFAYIDIQDEPTAFTHTPRVGFSYQITQTLRGGISGGPTILMSDGETTLSPGVTASLTQIQRWGSMGLAYDRAVRTGGGVGGVSDVQTITGNVSVTTLARGFALAFTPRYTISESEEDVARSRSDTKALTLNLSARYQIARYIAIVGAYTFFNQRADGDSSGRSDVDQNRVTIGLQFGYPISFY